MDISPGNPLRLSYIIEIMDLYIKNVREAACACDVVILPVTEGDRDTYNSVGPSVAALLKRISPKEFPGRQNEVLFVPSPGDVKPGMILLAGLGRRNDISHERLRKAGGKAGAYLRNMEMKKIALSTRLFPLLKMSPADFVEGFLLGSYSTGKHDLSIEIEICERDRRQGRPHAPGSCQSFKNT